MAYITVTNSFTNGTTASATDVNTNFTDIINGTSDGTKDFSINALTVAGTLTANGNCTFGNASSDDLTFTGSLASDFPIKTNTTYDIGSSTLGLAELYMGGSSTYTAKLVSATLTGSRTYTIPEAGTNASFLMTEGSQSIAGTRTHTRALTVDGSADEVQLTVQGNATQTSNVFVVETSAGTDILAVSTSGAAITGNLTVSSYMNTSSRSDSVASLAYQDLFTPSSSQTYLVMSHTINSGGVGERASAFVAVDSGGNVGVTQITTSSHTHDTSGGVVRVRNGNGSFTRNILSTWIRLA